MKHSLRDDCERDDDFDDFVIFDNDAGCFGAVNIVNEADRDMVDIVLRFESTRDLLIKNLFVDFNQ